MTTSDSDKYMTAEKAAATLGVSERTIYRYGETGQIRTRKSGRRTMFHAGDVAQIAEDMQQQRRGPDPDEVQKLQSELQQANYRIGYLQAQLEQRLLPDHARQIQDELATAKAERDQLAQQIQRLAAPWRTWLLIGLIIVVAILATLLVSVFAFGAR
jgi:excisionase family DNA binding protein